MRRRDEPERGEDLDPGVPGVDLQRRVGMCRERTVDVVDPIVEDAEELEQFGAHLRVLPREVDRGLQRGCRG